MTITNFFRIVELRTKVISVSTYTLATLYLVATGSPVDPLLAALLFAAVLLVDMGTTAFNSFYDYLRGVDNRLFTVEPDKVLVFSGVAPGHALLVSLSLYFAAAVIGLFVALMVGWWIVGVGALCMLVGFLYTGGPLPISRTPLGELFAGGFLGSVLFLVIVAAHGDAVADAFVSSLPSTLLIASVLTVNNTCDREGDIASGRRTLSVVVGRRGGTFLLYLLGTLAFLIAAALPPVGPWGLVPLTLAFAATIVIYRGMARRGYSHATKPANMRAIITVVVLYTLGYGTALLL